MAVPNKNTSLLVFIGIIISIAAGYILNRFEPTHVLIICSGLALAVVSFVRPEIGLLILILGMTLSPEIILVRDPSHDVIIRIEDIFLIIVFIAWFTRISVYKQLAEEVRLPLRVPITLYILISIIATSLGVLRGEISFLKSFFYLLKYAEYFLIFFVGVNVIKTERYLKLYLWTLLACCVIITLFVYRHMDITNPYYRASTLFEGAQQSEPASLGGYYLIMLALAMGFIICQPSMRMKSAFMFFFLSILPPFIATQPRSSYFAFVPLLLCAFILSKRWTTLIIISLMMILVIPLITLSPLGKVIERRILYTFATPFSEDIPFEPSTAARVSKWKILVPEWLKDRPIFGYGVTGVGLVDAQIPRVIGETGLMGLAAFAWIFISLWNMTRKNMRTLSHPLAQTISIGFLAGFIGLLVQSIGANTFIIIRIMEPFWILAAIVLVLPSIYPVSDRTQIEHPRS
jgi:hypothetical protein